MLKMRCDWAESGIYPGAAKFHLQASEAEQMSSRSAWLTVLFQKMWVCLKSTAMILTWTEMSEMFLVGAKNLAEMELEEKLGDLKRLGLLLGLWQGLGLGLELG